MTQAAVRDWLSGVITAANTGLEVFDRRFKVTPTADMVLFFSFESDEHALTMGDVGAIYETIYSPQLIILLADPDADQAQAALDRYSQRLRHALRLAPRNVPLTDAETGEQSTLFYIHQRIPVTAARIEDVSQAMGEEADVMATVVLQPQICEIFTRSAV